MTWDPRATARWVLGLAIPVLLLSLAWREVDPRAGASLLACAGPLLPLVLLPYAGVLACDALGWRTLMSPGTRRRARVRDVFAARLAGESVVQTLPWTGLGGEVASAWLLERLRDVPAGRSLGGLVVRRLLLAPSHGILLVAAALAALGQPSLPRAFVAAGFATGVLLLLAAPAGSRLVVRGSLLLRLQAGLRRLPPWRLKRGVAWPSLRLAEADQEARRLLSGPWRPRAGALLFFVLVFAAEAGETWLLLRFLGVHATATQVLAIEPLVSLARAVAVFAPAGLGVQDLGYLSLLQLVGIPDARAVGLAFVLLKRMRGLVWTGAGWSLLLLAGVRRRGARGEVSLEPRAQEDPVHLWFPEPDDADAPDRARAVGA